MRDIKFRVWDRSIEKFIEHRQKDKTIKKCFGFYSRKEMILVQEQFEFLQYTGLKDKNGKEIYEGDVVILNASHKAIGAVFEPEKHVVQWRENSPTMDMLNIKYINADRKIGITFDNGMVDEIEVIGNIFENPELLEKDRYHD